MAAGIPVIDVKTALILKHQYGCRIVYGAYLYAKLDSQNTSNMGSAWKRLKSVRKVEHILNIKPAGYGYAGLRVVNYPMHASMKAAASSGKHASNRCADPGYHSSTPDFPTILPAHFNHYKNHKANHETFW